MCIVLMMEEYGQDIYNVLQQDFDNFFYEYYFVWFSIFFGGYFVSFRCYLCYLFLDSVCIDNEYVVQEYMCIVYSVNVLVVDWYWFENSYW